MFPNIDRERLIQALTSRPSRDSLVYFDPGTDRFVYVRAAYGWKEIEERGLVPADSGAQADYVLAKHGDQCEFQLAHPGFVLGGQSLPLAPVQILPAAYGKAMSYQVASSGMTIERKHGSIRQALMTFLRQGYYLNKSTFLQPAKVASYAQAA